MSSKGFTVIEIILVVAILALVVGYGAVVNINTYRAYLFRSERSTLVALLDRARNQSMNNINQTNHGVCYSSTTRAYILYEGSSCVLDASSSVVVRTNPGVVVTGISAPGVLFSQLAGTTSGAIVHISDGVRSADITINYEGRINW